MNNERRKEIDSIIMELTSLVESLESQKGQIEDLRDVEQEYYDCMPESIQSGEKGDKAEESVDCLTSAFDDLDSVDFGAIISNLEDSKG